MSGRKPRRYLVSRMNNYDHRFLFLHFHNGPFNIRSIVQHICTGCCYRRSSSAPAPLGENSATENGASAAARKDVEEGPCAAKYGPWLAGEKVALGAFWALGGTFPNSISHRRKASRRGLRCWSLEPGPRASYAQHCRWSGCWGLLGPYRRAAWEAEMRSGDARYAARPALSKHRPRRVWRK